MLAPVAGSGSVSSKSTADAKKAIAAKKAANKAPAVNPNDPIGSGAKFAMDQIYDMTLGGGINAAARKGDATKLTPMDAVTLGTMGLGAGMIGTGAKALKGVNPAGLKAVAETMAMARRGKNPATAYVDQALRNNAAGILSGPGTYFGKNTSDLATTWGSEYGDYIKKIALSPSAALNMSKGKGYLPFDKLKTVVAETDGVMPYSVADPRIQKLMSEGYVGVKDTGVRTNWLLGNTPGVDIKTVGKLSPQNSLWVNPSTAGQKLSNAYRTAATKIESKYPVQDALKMNSRLSNKQLAKQAALTLKSKVKPKKVEAPRNATSPEG